MNEEKNIFNGETPTEEQVDLMIEKELGIELTDEEKLIAMMPSKNPKVVNIDSALLQKGDLSPKMMTHIYNTDTGMSVPVGEYENNEDIDADKILNSFLTGNSIIDESLIESVVKGDDNTMNLSVEEIRSLMSLVNDHLNNKSDIDYYNRLPEYLQRKLFGLKGGSFSRQLRKSMAKDFIENIATDYLQQDSNADLGLVLDQLQNADKELKDGMNSIEASAHVTLINNSLIGLVEQKEKMISEGKEDSADKIQNILYGLYEAINLTKFKEFCKTVRIKNYDIENPKRIFEDFNHKYYSHRLNINNIYACPGILQKHVPEHVEDYKCLKICLAFCKFCINKSPDNPKDHAFMYYFIKNIIIMDLLYASVKSVSIIDDNVDKECLDFYNNQLSNIKECMENLK